jgi:hypothetical protein
MGARGATASSEAADVVLVVDRLDRLVDALRVARWARRIARQSALAGMGLSLVAMGVAAAGLLVPVAGAVVQELIDVAVILNALRALGGGGVAPRRRGPEVAVWARLYAEHRRLLPAIDRIAAVADRLDELPPAAALDAVRGLHRFLVERVLPHERADELVHHPELTRALGGDEVPAAMSRAHAEIANLTRLLGGLLEELAPDGPEREDLPELRRVLYGLHAVLRLHFAEEDEAYLALAGPAGFAPDGPGPAGVQGPPEAPPEPGRRPMAGTRGDQDS